MSGSGIKWARAKKTGGYCPIMLKIAGKDFAFTVRSARTLHRQLGKVLEQYKAKEVSSAHLHGGGEIARL